MKSKRLEDYAMIGDCETAALVSHSGAIDWLCWPDFSSPACFAALLGSPDNGHWTLAPRDKLVSSKRQYQPHTLILETTMETRRGKVIVTDFMPIRGRNSDVVRTVRCVSGAVVMHMTLCLRFEYGKAVPWIDPESGSVGPQDGGVCLIARVGPNLAVLRTDAAAHESTPGTIFAEFTLKAGDTRKFALTYGSAYEDVPAPINIDQALLETRQFWTQWASRCQYKGPYSEAVERSFITLKAMIYRPSGGIVAAMTTSLPERLGGPLNWDYRYCWIRDATLTLSALLDSGHTEEIAAWKKWLIAAIGPDASEVQIMYGIKGERSLAERNIPWLPGYEKSTPVRVGNAAQTQIQQDIYGEIAMAFFHARQAGIPLDTHELQLQQALTEHLARIWQEPGSGMWEEREHPQRFTFSGVMAWLALERAVKSIEQHDMGGPLKQWQKLRDKIRADVLKRGFNTRLNSFVQHYGSKRLDASVLLLPIFGFLPANDPRMLGTVKAVEKELLKDGLLLRNLPTSSKAKQGAFLACSFWLVEIYSMQGRIAEATSLFERLLSLRNDVGLLSEEYDSSADRLIGNFPQAFSHIALVQAAARLAGAH
jgi:GH15 family glucan-1,4-alpha-glucosidase